MSTKTTFKRVALVVVAALGFGVLTSVAPALAVAGTPETATSVVIGTVPTGRVGVASNVPFKIYTAGLIAGETLNINAEITSAPLSGGAANAASALGSAAASNGNNAGLQFSINSSTTVNETSYTVTTLNGRINAARSAGGVDYVGATDGAVSSSVPAYVILDSDVAKGYVSGNVTIKPDVTGTYTALVSATNFGASYGLTRAASANTMYNAGDISASFSFTTAGAPTSVSITQLAGGTIHAGSPYGVPMAVTLVGGTLGALDAIDLTTSGSGTISIASAANYATTKSLTSTSFAGGQTAVILSLIHI